MPTDGIKFHGAEQLQRELRRVSVRARGNIALRALRAGGNVIADAARDNVRKSQYASSLEPLTRKRRGGIYVVARRVKRLDTRAVRIATRRSVAWWAHFFEFGTQTHEVGVSGKRVLARASTANPESGAVFGRAVTVRGISAIRFLTKAISSPRVQQRALDAMAAKMREGIKRGS